MTSEGPGSRVTPGPLPLGKYLDTPSPSLPPPRMASRDPAAPLLAALRFANLPAYMIAIRRAQNAIVSQWRAVCFGLSGHAPRVECCAVQWTPAWAGVVAMGHGVACPAWWRGGVAWLPWSHGVVRGAWPRRGVVWRAWPATWWPATWWRAWRGMRVWWRVVATLRPARRGWRCSRLAHDGQPIDAKKPA